MSTARLPLPSELKWELTARLPRWENEEARVFVTPCDKDGRRCAAWRADHYCIQAFYTPTAVPSLGPLEQALQVWPGVYRTTKVHVLLDDNGQMIGKTPLPVDRDWPDKKRITDPYLRPQVWALIRDDQNQLPFRRIGDGVYESKGYWGNLRVPHKYRIERFDRWCVSIVGRKFTEGFNPQGYRTKAEAVAAASEHAQNEATDDQ